MAIGKRAGLSSDFNGQRPALNWSCDSRSGLFLGTGMGQGLTFLLTRPDLR